MTETSDKHGQGFRVIVYRHPSDSHVGNVARGDGTSIDYLQLAGLFQRG